MPIRSIGESLQLNSSETGDQAPARIAELQDGGFVGFWHSLELEDQSLGSVIRARIFDDEGRALGDDFVMNQERAGTMNPSVQPLENGGFIAQWSYSYIFMGLPWGPNARIFDADGVAQGDEAPVGRAAGTAVGDSLTALSDGRFLSVWSTFWGDGIRARVLDEDGTPVGRELAINNTDTGNETGPMALALPGGRFMVAWITDQEFWEDDIPDDMSIRVRFFHADGRPGGRDFQVNDPTPAPESRSLRSIEPLSEHRILVSWWTYEEDGHTRSTAMARVVSTDGRALGEEFPVPQDPPTETDGVSFVVTALADGRELVTWSIRDERSEVVHAEIRNARGEAITDQFPLDVPRFSQVNPFEDGRILLTWSDDPYYGGDGHGTHGRFFDTTAFSGSAGADFWTGGTLADRIAGGGGNDQLLGMGDDDRLTGGSGNDRLGGGAGNDRLIGGAGSDRLSGGPGRDRLEGGGGPDTLVGGRGRDLLDGGAGADTFRFQSVADSRPAARDEIRDFARGEDCIDLIAIDGRRSDRGNQAFDYIGAARFSDEAGELRFKHGILRGDVDGDGCADFAITLAGLERLDASDILL